MIIYGLMKFIEQIPERYDRMIGWLTLGGLQTARQVMLADVRPGMRVLDVGCGTGSFLLEAAGRGAICVGVDASLPMLEVFRRKLASTSPEIRDRITIVHQSASLLNRAATPGSFDLVTSSLMLGELPTIVLDAVLRQIPEMLIPGGKVLICDELWPRERWRSLAYSFVLAVTFVPNFILTRTMIRPVKGLEERMERHGLRVTGRTDFAWGVVSVVAAEPCQPNHEARRGPTT
ncbi:MAG TPA: methyltransferase domain-containing protein [Candidatus Ozemobacteraceae bacterium]|nr:methyltransferase domain-containing protein [Candidatus Ozemobacteraceae bacterium]